MKRTEGSTTGRKEGINGKKKEKDYHKKKRNEADWEEEEPAVSY